MNTKVDFTFYTDIYRGEKIGDGKLFSRLSDKAESAVRQYIGNRPVPQSGFEDFGKCVCELSERFYDSEARDGVKSESTDGLSVTYGGDCASVRAVGEIIRRRLANTGLLYRGIEIL